MRGRRGAADGRRARAHAAGAVLLALLFAAPPARARPLDAPRPATADRALNLSHIDHLFAEAVVGGERVGVLRIYSEAPDYRFAIEPREGYACVDDVARGLVLLAAASPDARRRGQIDLLARFVLRMQADNGYFHNFVWGDGRINRSYRTSLAELNWWSLRALWGLEAAIPLLPSDTARRARAAADRLVANLVRDLPARAATETFDGIAVPTSLPFGSGADAASTATIALLAHERRAPEAATRALIARLGEGMVRMAAGDAARFPYGAHLSWRNRWHAWGNAQAYALLRAGRALDRPDFIASARREIDGFYPHLLARGQLSAFALHRDGGMLRAREIEAYPQIAYGIAPMVLAAGEAYRQTGEGRYRVLARRLAAWFGGDNGARAAMYDPASGRVYDGIVAPGRVNRNAGAESTIEGLFALLAARGTALP